MGIVLVVAMTPVRAKSQGKAFGPDAFFLGKTGQKHGKAEMTGTLETMVHDTRVGGDRTLSYETDESYNINSLSLRGLLELKNASGGTAQWSLRLNNSSKFLEEEWQVEQATGSIVKDEYILDYWDTRPLFSDYTLQGRRVRGIDLKKPWGPVTLNFVAGYEPALQKALGVKRRVGALRIHHKRALWGLDAALNLVANDDNHAADGFSPGASAQVGSIQLEGQISRKARLRAEASRSNPATGAVAGAQLIEISLRGRRWQGRASHEAVDTGYVAPLAAASNGLTETKGSYALLISRYVTLTLAHKRRRYPGDRQRDSVVGLRVQPQRWRSRLTAELRWLPRTTVTATGRTRTQGYHFTVSDKVGIHVINIDLLNEDIDRQGLSNQDKRQYQFTANSNLTPKITLRNRFRRFAQRGLARERYVETALIWEPKEWHNLELMHTYKDDRLGEGDRREISLRYGWLDIQQDIEYSLEYRRERLKRFANRHLEVKVAKTF